ncbi:MAG: hypothetical protein L0229_23640 [Blastocatellia bacterium]|nr:hypothetical protein [Blastocatellia bacterium]
MIIARLDKVLEEVKALTLEEKRRLREKLEELLAETGPQMTEQEFEQWLLERGIISRIPPPITDFTPYKNRKPIKVKGKPVSEFLLEERR